MTTVLDDLSVNDLINFEYLDDLYLVFHTSDNYIMCKNADLTKNEYTIIDVRNNKRGTHGSFVHGATTLDDCKETLQALETGEISMSCRNILPLDILEVTHVKAK